MTALDFLFVGTGHASLGLFSQRADEKRFITNRSLRKPINRASNLNKEKMEKFVPDLKEVLFRFVEI